MITLDVEALTRVCAELRAGKPLDDVAAGLGVSRSRLVYLQGRDPVLGEAYKAGKAARAAAARAAADEEDDRRDRRPRVSDLTVAEAITAASDAVLRLAGRDPRLETGGDWAQMRRVFHTLGDGLRRAVLVRLIIDESARIDRDRESSFTQRPRNSAKSLGEGWTPARRGDDS